MYILLFKTAITLSIFRYFLIFIEKKLRNIIEVLTKCYNFALEIKQKTNHFDSTKLMTTTIDFTKMHGCGNNYIYVYLPDNPIPDLKEAAIEWSRANFGIGSDGLITIDKSDVADFKMRIFNNDGSEAMMCGNGVRCCGKFVRDHHLTEKSTVTFETLSGIKILDLFEDEHGVVTSAKVDMGEPILTNKAQLATPDGSITEGEIGGWKGTYVCMGNPHFVIFVDDISKIDLPVDGKKMEFNPMFPERCNIEFAQILPDGTIRMRVWERGSGITMACGTGACATSVAATLTKRTGRTNTIIMDGGALTIQWGEDNHIYMTGPATKVFEGKIEL